LSAGPFFVKERPKALAKSLQQGWQFSLARVTAAQCGSYWMTWNARTKLVPAGSHFTAGAALAISSLTKS